MTLQNIQWHEASHGLSATAELLVRKKTALCYLIWCSSIRFCLWLTYPLSVVAVSAHYLHTYCAGALYCIAGRMYMLSCDGRIDTSDVCVALYPPGLHIRCIYRGRDASLETSQDQFLPWNAMRCVAWTMLSHGVSDRLSCLSHAWVFCRND